MKFLPIEHSIFPFHFDKGGVIRVFTSHNPFAPLLTAIDPDPIRVRYFSLASATRVQFFYDVSESLLVDPTKPLPTIKPADIEIVPINKHPLLSVIEVPIGSEEECKYLNRLNFECLKRGLIY